MRIAARHRHALGGAQELARLGRDDPLLAGDQRDLLLALDARRRGHRPRARAAAAGSRSCPDEWPHIRSIARWVLPVLVGPRIARTGASERGAIVSECGSATRNARFHSARDFKAVLTSIRDTGARVVISETGAAFGRAEAPHPLRARALRAASGLEEPRRAGAAVQHRRLGVASAAIAAHRPATSCSGRRSGSRRSRATARPAWRWRATAAVEPIDVRRQCAPVARCGRSCARAVAAAATGPLRIRGRVGDGLYWSLRQPAPRRRSRRTISRRLRPRSTSATVLRATVSTWCSDAAATCFTPALPASANAPAAGPLGCRRPHRWIDAANRGPAPVESGLMMPVAGHITSYFGYRYHPILHYTRFHAGLDIGASWGARSSPQRDGRSSPPGGRGDTAAKCKSRMPAE